MHPIVRLGLLAAILGAMVLLGLDATAQQAPAPRAPTPKVVAPPPPAAVPNPSGPQLPYRRLAPGVMEPIDPTRQQEETVTRHDVTELIAVDANFDWAADVPFRHDVWMLKFEFKPVRMIWVDIPGNQGLFQRKLIWYLVYSVTNPGRVMHPVENEDGTFRVEVVDKPLRFIPSFSLEAHNRLQDEAAGFTKVYGEKYVPLALGAIRAREDRYRQFRSSVEMPRQEIHVNETVWGIATWEDIDPRTVWFSVYVEGLTNAYRWKDDSAKYSAVLKGLEKGSYRSMSQKVLQLNFWRPGDEYSLKEAQVRFGAPGHPEYEWIWRRTF